MNPDVVVNELVERGYRKVPQPLHVADIDFDFAGALTGPGDQEHLTLILDGQSGSIAPAQRRLQAFAVVLDRSGSARPISVVVLSNSLDPKALAELEATAHVVVVDPDRPLSESLSSLLPLELPEPIASTGSADAALKEELGAQPDQVCTRLIRAARESADKVESTMQAILREASEEHK